MSQQLFNKILVANRGEIACRVFATAKRMGIATVAIHSDVDARALHVQMADEGVSLGGVTAAESYLDIDKVIDACIKTGADAVHPGYGFLSENAEFPERLQAKGIAFIGPDPKAIELMGDKITSKKLSAEAGVNTVPGFMGLIDDAEHCVNIATDVGYPVMIKASAGGGGKGMRIAWNDDEAREGFARSKSEAKSSFGDDRIFVEKFIVNPRHIEIQVLADKHGNCIYLAERECSIQRRNQKVVEEAPSPFLDETTRAAMGHQAVELSKAVEYASAGTVEFIVDEQRNFYFLEMNTRLQVEHPVTELITGVDLVEQMIRVAAGEALALQQNDVTLTGWAVESRLYAEDPTRNFLPSTGRLVRYRPPSTDAESVSTNVDLADTHADSAVNRANPAKNRGNSEGIVRCDSGVAEGGEISMYYDPMIAKLCTWEPTREAAIASMSDALDQFELEGVGNNLRFLSSIMNRPRFIEGRLTTAFIDEEYPDGFTDSGPDAQALDTFIEAAAVAQVIDKLSGMSANRVLRGAHESTVLEAVVRIGRDNYPVQIIRDAAAIGIRLHDDRTVTATTDWQPGQTIMALDVDGSRKHLQIARIAEGWQLQHGGFTATARVLTAKKASLAELMLEKQAADTSKYLLCPMPGLIVALHVQEGDTVEAGQALAVVEAMKMENVLSAAKAGVVAKIPVTAGQSLQVDDVIMEFADE